MNALLDADLMPIRECGRQNTRDVVAAGKADPDSRPSGDPGEGIEIR